MLDTQDFANWLSDNLNAIGAEQTDKYSFNVIAEVGEVKHGGLINCIVRSLPPELVPVRGYVEVRYVFAVDFIVPAAKTNYNYLHVSEIVNALVKANQATIVAFGDGTGTITLTTGAPKKYDITYGIGEAVPLSITARVTYTENAVQASGKHWYLDGVAIPFLRESVTLEQDGMQRKVFTEKYTRTILTGHTKYYNFRVPYESSFGKLLQQEMLQTPDLRHTLTYYDGEAFTQENPFTADVVIFRTAVSSAEMPTGSMFDITFTDVYDGIGKALQYELALIDFPFDMNGEDTRYFASQAAQQAYFEQKAAASTAPFVEIDAPTLDNLMITRQVYKNSTDGMSQFDYASKNYAIVKITTANATKYFYYFVENCTIGSDGQVVVDLKMDTVQTYFFDPSVTFSDCLIERAHLNRFVDAGNGNVKFVSDPASKIFNSEEGLNFPKRMVKRTKLDLQFTGDAEVDAWLNENVAYWVYVFISPNHSYSVYNVQTAEITEVDGGWGKIAYPTFLEHSGNENNFEQFESAAAVFCYPIYKNAINLGYNSPTENKNVIEFNICRRYYDSGTGQYQTETYRTLYPSVFAKNDFENGNPDNADNPTTPYYFSIKLSIVPPFNSAMSMDGGEPDPYLSMRIDPDTNNLVMDCISVGDRAYIHGEDGDPGYVISTSADNRGLFFGACQSEKITSNNYAISQNQIISKNTIIEQKAPNPSFNPKLNGQNFKELMITAASGDSFTYDEQKLVEPAITFEYSEPILPEITKYYMRVTGDTGLYVAQTDENYMGLVGSTDNGIAFVNSQYASFIANNKNFYLQSNLKIGANLAGGLLGAAGKAVSGAITGAAGGPVGSAAGAVIGGVSGVVGSVISAGISFIDRSLTVDNMKNAPDQMKNANGNVILNLFATELGLYVEEYSALDGDLKTANDFMDLYGFTFGAVANVKDYANIRKYHNFIKAQLQSINGNLSNTARADLRNRFASGVRFWNGDTISYQYENYENWLDN